MRVMVVASDEQELRGFGDEVIKVVSGCGMENAAVATVKGIYEHKPEVVINVGTAGAREGLEVGKCYWIKEVYNRDYDLTKYRLAPYAMLGANRTVEHSLKLEEEGYVLSSSNGFTSSPISPLFDIYDMEGYGVAKACAFMKTECHILKGISDRVGKNLNLKDYRTLLKNLKEQLAAEVHMRFSL